MFHFELFIVLIKATTLLEFEQEMTHFQDIVGKVFRISLILFQFVDIPCDNIRNPCSLSTSKSISNSKLTILF